MAPSRVLQAGALLSSLASAAVIAPRQDASNLVTVDLTVNRGTPKHYGSGVLLGIPDDQWPGMESGQIPDRFYSDISFSYNRGGGSQLPQGAWVTGLDGYYSRLNSTKSDYDRTRSFGASFIIMPHDVWGTDQVGVNDTWPGDNGDWTDYYAFLDQLTSDLVRLDMLDAMSWDVWNEPDIDIFWRRPISQWTELYVRTHTYIRSKPELNAMEIMGPAMQIGPEPENPWWTAWLTAVADNNIPPDQYSYHLLYGNDIDLARFNASLTTLLADYGLSERQVNANEYARPEQQVPSTSAWFVSRFERYDTWGLRANWASACQLHDFLANLLTKTGAPEDSECGGTGYAPNGQWWMYAYYGTNMTGYRVASTGSADGVADAFATVGQDKVRVLAGVAQQVGTWQLRIEGLEEVGLPASGEVAVQTWAFNDEGLYGAVEGPEDRGVVVHQYAAGAVEFPILVPEVDLDTSFAFEFEVVEKQKPGYGHGKGKGKGQGKGKGKGKKNDH